MPLHMLKLCVGAESVADLEAWIATSLAARRAKNLVAEQTHTTRMVPSRKDEIVDGGSLYWVVKGEVACRQRITDIRPFVDGDGIRRCHLVLEPVVIKVESRPHRPFQGWRYLSAHEAPADVAAGGSAPSLPEELRRELRSLGLL